MCVDNAGEFSGSHSGGYGHGCLGNKVGGVGSDGVGTYQLACCGIGGDF